MLPMQESVRTKHPQLLYESKLYKILQGGSEFPATLLSGLDLVVRPWTARGVVSAVAGSALIPVHFSARNQLYEARCRLSST